LFGHGPHRASAPCWTTQCSFCLKEDHEVERIVAGPGVFICNECVALCDEIMSGATGDADPASIPYWESMDDERLLEQLPRIAAVAIQLDDQLHLWVKRARDRGVSWSRVGQSLGISRQSAWERFSQES
jgi:hypothetical protein